MKNFKILLLLILCNSCVKEGKYIYTINNKSNCDFSVVYKQWAEKDTTILIPNNRKIIFYSYGGTGFTPSDKGQGFLNSFDTIFLQTPDTVEMIKDFYKRDNWEFKWGDGDGSYNDGVGEYNFIINMSDLKHNE